MSSTNDIHPAILRVSKQLHDEAITTLYRNVDCEIWMAREWGILHQSFFFRDQDPESDARQSKHWFITQFPTTRGWFRRLFRQRENRVMSAEDSSKLKARFKAEDMLNLPCLWLVSNIKIKFQWSELFGQFMSTPCTNGRQHFTSTGLLVLQILRHVKNEPITTSRIPRTLHLSIEGGDSLKTFVTHMGLWVTSTAGRQEPIKGARQKELYEGISEIIQLLKAIKSRRSVRMTEVLGCFCSVHRHLLPELEVDWESFPWTGEQSIPIADPL